MSDPSQTPGLQYDPGQRRYYRLIPKLNGIGADREYVDQPRTVTTSSPLGPYPASPPGPPAGGTRPSGTVNSQPNRRVTSSSGGYGSTGSPPAAHATGFFPARTSSISNAPRTTVSQSDQGFSTLASQLSISASRPNVVNPAASQLRPTAQPLLQPSQTQSRQLLQANSPYAVPQGSVVSTSASQGIRQKLYREDRRQDLKIPTPSGDQLSSPNQYGVLSGTAYTGQVPRGYVPAYNDSPYAPGYTQILPPPSASDTRTRDTGNNHPQYFQGGSRGTSASQQHQARPANSGLPPNQTGVTGSSGSGQAASGAPQGNDPPHGSGPPQSSQQGNPDGRYRDDRSTTGETVDPDVVKDMVRGTSGLSELLDPNYRVMLNHWDFFVIGRVFMMLSWEPVGRGNPAAMQNANSVVKYGETAFAKIYRYVVVRARPKQGYSMCLRISTYGDRGVAGNNNLHKQSDHSIIYTGPSPPSKLPEERGMNKDPIQVLPVPSQTLRPRSRVHYAKPYPVEHNVKVLEVGRVAEKDNKKLVGYYMIASGYDSGSESQQEPVRRPRRESGETQQEPARRPRRESGSQAGHETEPKITRGSTKEPRRRR